MIDYEHEMRVVRRKFLYGVIRSALALLLATPVCAADTGDNLLLNPSFENVNSGVPDHWKVFVTPQSGAEGRVDDQNACHGHVCAQIRNANRIEPDPCHNWSQDLSGEFAKKTLIVGGVIKTADADGAALWLQCWRKEPLGVLRVATTTDTYPLSGANDWTPVAMKVVVPEETDFLILRCVLKGKGAAWFDDLRVIDSGAEGKAEDLVKDLKPAAEAPGPDDGQGIEKKMLQETESIANTIKELRESNENLNKELDRVRGELKTIKDNLQPVRRVPPIVPHGYLTEESP